MFATLLMVIVGVIFYLQYRFGEEEKNRLTRCLRTHGYPQSFGFDYDADRPCEEFYIKIMDEACHEYWGRHLSTDSEEIKAARVGKSRLDLFVIMALEARKKYTDDTDNPHPFIVLMQEYAKRRKLLETPGSPS